MCELEEVVVVDDLGVLLEEVEEDCRGDDPNCAANSSPNEGANKIVRGEIASGEDEAVLADVGADAGPRFFGE